MGARRPSNTDVDGPSSGPDREPEPDRLMESTTPEAALAAERQAAEARKNGPAPQDRWKELKAQARAMIEDRIKERRRRRRLSRGEQD